MYRGIWNVGHHPPANSLSAKAAIQAHCCELSGASASFAALAEPWLISAQESETALGLAGGLVSSGEVGLKLQCFKIQGDEGTRTAHILGKS